MTVKLRIAVVVDDKGRWEAYGSSKKDVDSRFHAEDNMAEWDYDEHPGELGLAHYWIEADIAAPSVLTARGKVLKGSALGPSDSRMA